VILYLDSSSIVKLYVQETDTAEMKRQAAAAEEVASSRIAYAEVRSALARKRREGGISQAEYARTVAAFRSEWLHITVQEVTQQVVELAGAFCEAHKLRGMDAIHLASAKLLADATEAPVRISSSDPRLREAATAEGMA
jgi:predicted nucleic acid-binding protein